jgi:outer membrane biosynthesis protein TonB
MLSPLAYFHGAELTVSRELELLARCLSQNGNRKRSSPAVNMVHPFISAPSSRTSLPRRIGGVSLSAAVHTALIASAVVATLPPPMEFLVSGGEVARPRIEYVRMVRPPAANDDSESKDKEKKDAKGETKPAEAAVMMSTPSVTEITGAEIAPVVAPDLDLESETLTWAAHQFGDSTSVSSIAESVRRMYAPPTNGAYDREVVEKTVWPRPNNPRPAYPSSLLSMGVEAHVLARFVVDSTGRVSEKSLVFPQNAHRLFVEAIKRALLRSRFFPAELAGHRVSQHVIQEFVFRIER